MTGIPKTLDRLSVSVDSLKPYPGNPRRGNVDSIVKSLERNGQYRPIVVNKRTSEVLAGNHTLLAARKLGWDEIAATFVDVDEDQAARIVLVDNRANDVAGYDDDELRELLESLPDLDGTGWDENALAELLGSVETLSPGADTDAGELPKEPRTVLGDVYVLGDHRLVCGDSTNLTDVDCLMGGLLAQLVYTDPPYGVDYTGGTKKREGLAGDNRNTTIYADVMPSILAVSDEKAAVYLWHAGTRAFGPLNALNEAGYEVRAQIIWVKNQAQFGALGAQYKQKHEPCFYAFRKGTSPYWYGPNNEVTVWDHDRDRVNEFHPTQKPPQLCERALSNHTQPMDVVVDLFGGSGSTMIAAENLGRRAYLMELSPSYCDVIVDRWERHTGKKAELARQT